MNTFAHVTLLGVKLLVSFESQWGTAGILIRKPGVKIYIIKMGNMKYHTKFRIE